MTIANEIEMARKRPNDITFMQSMPQRRQNFSGGGGTGFGQTGVQSAQPQAVALKLGAFTGAEHGYIVVLTGVTCNVEL